MGLFGKRNTDDYISPFDVDQAPDYIDPSTVVDRESKIDAKQHQREERRRKAEKRAERRRQERIEQAYYHTSQPSTSHPSTASSAASSTPAAVPTSKPSASATPPPSAYPKPNIPPSQPAGSARPTTNPVVNAANRADQPTKKPLAAQLGFVLFLLAIASLLGNSLGVLIVIGAVVYLIHAIRTRQSRTANGAGRPTSPASRPPAAAAARSSTSNRAAAVIVTVTVTAIIVVAAAVIGVVMAQRNTVSDTSRGSFSWSADDEDDYDYITIPSSPTPTMSGMEFVGWCTNQSGTGTMYDPGDDVDVDCGATVTLYAIYEDPYVTYTLSYNANGGSGAPLSQSVESSTGSATFTLRTNEPTRDGYIFLGWTTNSSGTGTLYQPGGTYSTSSTSTTMYAKWEQAVIEITSSLPSDLSYFVGEQFTYAVSANVDGCTVSVSGADWIHVSGMTVTGTPVSPGSYDVTLTVSKSGYTSDTISFTIQVFSNMEFTSEPSASGIYAYLED